MLKNFLRRGDIPLHSESQRIRTETIQSRIAAAEVLCTVAESHAEWGHVLSARESLAYLHRALDEIRSHIRRPGFIFPEKTSELENLVALVQKRVDAVEASLPRAA